MPISTISFKDKKYPSFQSTGNAARFAMPFAKEIIGEGKIGFDIGCMKLDWAYPGAILIDKDFDDPWDAYSLPTLTDPLEYIFSSHCLEHLPDWVGALNYWNEVLSPGGVLFLYLPHKTQEYWHPWNNRKHYHLFDFECMDLYFKNNTHLWSTTFVSTGADLNNSFYCVAEKK